jgi:hypothetical protein
MITIIITIVNFHQYNYYQVLVCKSLLY